MVSIKLVWYGGIITHAKTAVDKYGKAQQNEIDQINAAFGGDNNALEELQKYVLGEDLKGQPISNIANIGTNISFKPLNGENIEMLNYAEYFYTENNEAVYDIAIYIRYKDKAYRILCENTNSSEFAPPTKSIDLVYEPKGDEGKTVEYSIDGTEANKKQWTILYDDGTNYEIVSPEAMGELTLGENDEQATGNNNFEKVVDSYNHAIERINAYASGFVTNSNKIAVRSVGSNPENPNSRNTEKYTSEKLESWNWKNEGVSANINGLVEGTDNNYEQDLVRMNYFGIAEIGESYWFASRCVKSDSNWCNFGVVFESFSACIGESFNQGGFWWAVPDGAAYTSHDSCAVRPVVKISK